MNTLERYLFYECRPVVLSVLKSGKLRDITNKFGIHPYAARNYINFNYDDYKENHSKPHQYLSYKNIIDLLEYGGYKINIQIELNHH